MKKRISFSIFSEADYSIKQFTVSSPTFIFALLSVFIAFCLTGFFAVRGSVMRKTITPLVVLERTADNQRNQFDLQAQQISLLNEKLDTLGKKAEQLQTMENKIRKIAGIERPLDHDNLFGIGGSRAEKGTGANAVGGDKAPDSESRARGEDKIRQADMALDPASDKECILVVDDSNFYTIPLFSISSLLSADGGISTASGPPRDQPFRDQGLPDRGNPSKNDSDREIAAPANGVITFAGAGNSHESVVIIDHGHGYITRYTCLDAITKKAGELILKGEIVGRAAPGSDGSSLACEIFLNGLPVHPKKISPAII